MTTHKTNYFIRLQIWYLDAICSPIHPPKLLRGDGSHGDPAFFPSLVAPCRSQTQPGETQGNQRRYVRGKQCGQTCDGSTSSVKMKPSKNLNGHFAENYEYDMIRLSPPPPGRRVCFLQPDTPIFLVSAGTIRVGSSP